MLTRSLVVDHAHDAPAKKLVKIDNASEAYSAQLEYTMGMILSMPNKDRVDVCQELIKQSKAVDVTPPPLWQDVIDNPEQYKHWAAEHDRGIIG
jgi:hypothetical protein